MAIASGATTKNDVVERIRVGVQQGVQETESGLLGAKASVVEESDDATKGGGRAGGSLVALERTLVVDAVAKALSADVGESTSVAVEVGLVLLAELMEVCLYGIVLVRGTLPVVGETTRGEESGSLVEVAG